MEISKSHKSERAKLSTLSWKFAKNDANEASLCKWMKMLRLFFQRWNHLQDVGPFVRLLVDRIEKEWNIRWEQNPFTSAINSCILYKINSNLYPHLVWRRIVWHHRLNYRLFIIAFRTHAFTLTMYVMCGIYSRTLGRQCSTKHV